MNNILVTQRVEYNKNRNETRDCLDQKLVLLLTQCEMNVFPIPNSLGRINKDSELIVTWINKINPQGIVLSGGGDPYLEDDRFYTEEILIKWAEDNHLPLLGICRGMQRLVINQGGELNSVSNHVGQSHEIDGKNLNIVNSFHNLGISKMPADWTVTARAKDGVIEAMSHKSYPWEGWMWHPEREESPNPQDIKNLQNLFMQDKDII